MRLNELLDRNEPLNIRVFIVGLIVLVALLLVPVVISRPRNVIEAVMPSSATDKAEILEHLAATSSKTGAVSVDTKLKILESLGK